MSLQDIGRKLFTNANTPTDDNATRIHKSFCVTNTQKTSSGSARGENCNPFVHFKVKSNVLMKCFSFDECATICRRFEECELREIGGVRGRVNVSLTFHGDKFNHWENCDYQVQNTAVKTPKKS